MQSEDNNTMCVGGAIVVFAKCPGPNSKTRLSPLLGAEGASSLAQAMLSDILTSLSNQPLLKNTLKVLCYAPKSGEAQMISILQSLNLPYPLIYDDIYVDIDEEQFQLLNNSNTWILMPMKSTSDDLTSSSLGDKLEDALVRTRQLLDTREDSNKSVLFLGMDSPELPLEEIVHGLQVASSSNDNNKQAKAHLCPANDGGYGLLSLPYRASSLKIFKGVRWSHPLTAVSQMKALTDNNVDVSIGKLMFDIDEPNDVQDLAKRLVGSNDDDSKIIEEETDDVLTSYTHGIGSTDNIQQSFPHHTKNQLIDLGIIQIHDDKHVVKVDNDREKEEGDIDESTKVVSLQGQLRQAEHRATVLSDRLKIVKESGSSVIQSLNEELEDVAQHSAKVEAAMIKELSSLDSKRRAERSDYQKRISEWISLANNQKEDIDEYERKIESLLSTVLMMGDDAGSDV